MALNIINISCLAGHQPGICIREKQYSQHDLGTVLFFMLTDSAIYVNRPVKRVFVTRVQYDMNSTKNTGLERMIELKFTTPPEWAEGIVTAIDVFLPDHATAEKKASSMALTMVSHYPDKTELVSAMIDLALEELGHFRAVVKLMHARGLTLLSDEKDPYVNALRGSFRQGKEIYFMDRLLIAGIIEARGAERFGLVASALPDGDLKRFYDSITRSERTHRDLFLRLAERYFDATQVRSRLDDLLTIEANIVSKLPIRVALH